jgi:hypothetical protein
VSADARRAPAPPYEGEGPFSLWHLSEDPDLDRFEPRPPPGDPGGEPVVWAVDTRHLPLYWFPRDCPRGCAWAGPGTTEADRVDFGLTVATRVHVIETAWLARLASCRLFAYRLPEATFEHHGVGGYWVSRAAVSSTERVEVDGLPARHVAAGFELRVTPSIWPWWDRVVASTLEFSGCRLRNASPPPRVVADG